MGYTHGRRYSEEEVKREIFKVMKSLNINRMPSNSEINFVQQGSSLSNKISRSGGYRYWANKLGLSSKESETDLGQEWEIYVKSDLEKQGYEVESMSTKHPYDLLINNNIKIDVKVSRYYKNKGFKYHTFNLEKKYHNCDIFICIGLNEEDQIEKTLIIPSKYLMNNKQLSVGVESKYDKFQDRWDYIEKYSNFYAVTI